MSTATSGQTVTFQDFFPRDWSVACCSNCAAACAIACTFSVISRTSTVNCTDPPRDVDGANNNTFGEINVNTRMADPRIQNFIDQTVTQSQENKNVDPGRRGRLVFSVRGNGSVPNASSGAGQNLNFSDEDLVEWNGSCP